MLYAFWISVSRPNCAMRKLDQQARAARILGAADFACGFALLAPFSETGVDLFTMAATMLTAGIRHRRMISTEISGVADEFTAHAANVMSGCFGRLISGFWYTVNDPEDDHDHQKGI